MDDQSSIVSIIDEYALAEAVYTQAKERYSAARSGLLKLVPQEVGNFSIAGGKWQCDVSYPEKVKWDAEKLDAIYGDDKPHYVKASYSIDVRVLRKLPDSERTQLESAYEIVPGTPKINVEVV